MITLKHEETKTSFFMMLMPILLGFLILVPNRNVYLAFLFLMLIGYIAHNQFALVHDLVTGNLARTRKLKTEVDTTESGVAADNPNESREGSTPSG